MFENHEPESIPRPFVTAPDANRYFPSAVAEEARQRITRSIIRAEGPAVLIGASGTGKSQLLEVLARQFENQLEVVPLSGGQICTRRALLQTILYQLDEPFEGLDEGELRLALQGYLQPRSEPARRILLLVDEADTLPMRLLEELRVLSNTTLSGQALISMVLAGSPSLEERFADPELDRFSQRLSTRCYLCSLGREETFQYVRAQVASVGVQPEQLFAQDGLEALFGATDGLPRLVNQLGDQLVWNAWQSKNSPIGKEAVQQAWSELQQLPAPWETQQQEMPSFESGAVEFGDLASETVDDASSDELPASIPMNTAATGDSELIASYDPLEELLSSEPSDTGEVAIHEESIEVSIPEAARDPFAEEFGHEEIVLDRYTSFETGLLSDALQVTNMLDTSFAAELQSAASEISEVAVNTPKPEEVEPALRLELSPLEEIDTELDPEEDDEILEESHPMVATEPGDLLVLEDERRSRAELVSGGKFRQLFSSLESRQA